MGNGLQRYRDGILASYPVPDASAGGFVFSVVPDGDGRWLSADRDDFFYFDGQSSRHMLGVAYLDGKTPSLLVVRGTYGMMQRRRLDAAATASSRKLWRWTNERAPFKYQGQGQHSIKVGDIDGDGYDEILNGSIAIDHDGRTLWSTGMGHGDRFYLSDIDPRRPRPRDLVHASRTRIRRTASACGTRSTRRR